MTISFHCVSGSNILFHPLFGEGSHYYVQKNIAVELIRRGHNVTVLMASMFEDTVKADGKKEGFNVEIYPSPFTLHEINQFLANMTSAGVKGKYLDHIKERIQSIYMQKQIEECINLLGNERVLASLKRANFNLAIADMIGTCPVVQYLKIPHAMVSPLHTNTMTIANAFPMRSPVNPSYMPQFATALDHRMSFMDRLKNTGYAVLYCFFGNAFYYPFQAVLDTYDMELHGG